jgi:hypothetical protein
MEEWGGTASFLEGHKAGMPPCSHRGLCGGKGVLETQDSNMSPLLPLTPRGPWDPHPLTLLPPHLLEEQ